MIYSHFFSSFLEFNKAHGDFFFCVFKVSFFAVLLLFEVITWSLRLWAAHSGSSRGLRRHFSGNILLCFGRFYIMWHLWHYRLSQGWWRKWKICTGKDTHTHTHVGGSKRSYLVISDVLVLSCFYLLLLLFFICICCSLISVKHFLTNLFDKST